LRRRRGKPSEKAGPNVFPPKGPYDSKGTRKALEEMHPGRKVTSSTQPRENDRGMTFQDKTGDEAMRAGEPSPVLGAPHPTTGRMYDRRGVPNLDKETKATVDIPNPTRNPQRRDIDKRQAVKALQQQLKDNPQMRGRFTKPQLEAIDAGKLEIPELVWDHARETGRLKLVDKRAHSQNGHLGSFGSNNQGKGR
ncbi:MAG: HNH endonuclease, partial [Pseudomonadota bacterium]